MGTGTQDGCGLEMLRGRRQGAASGMQQGPEATCVVGGGRVKACGDRASVHVA